MEVREWLSSNLTFKGRKLLTVILAIQLAGDIHLLQLLVEFRQLIALYVQIGGFLLAEFGFSGGIPGLNIRQILLGRPTVLYENRQPSAVIRFNRLDIPSGDLDHAGGALISNNRGL